MGGVGTMPHGFVPSWARPISLWWRDGEGSPETSSEDSERHTCTNSICYRAELMHAFGSKMENIFSISMRVPDTERGEGGSPRS